jgi:hypothetical protein
LAERGTQLSNGLWMREVRERSADGSQSSILSNHRGLDLTRLSILGTFFDFFREAARRIPL